MEKKGRLKNKIKNFGIGNNEDYRKWDLNTGYICRICARDAKQILGIEQVGKTSAPRSNKTTVGRTHNLFHAQNKVIWC